MAQPAIARFVTEKTAGGFEVKDVANDRLAAEVNDLETEFSWRLDGEREEAAGVAGTQINVARNLVGTGRFDSGAIARTGAEANGNHFELMCSGVNFSGELGENFCDGIPIAGRERDIDANGKRAVIMLLPDHLAGAGEDDARDFV